MKEDLWDKEKLARVKEYIAADSAKQTPERKARNKMLGVKFDLMDNPDRVIDIINAYSTLEEGWDYGEGSPIKKRIIDLAIHYHCWAKSLGFLTEPHPCADGAISLTFHLEGKDHFLDVRIGNDASIEVQYEIGIGVEYDIVSEEENVVEQQITKLLNQVKANANDTKS